jgi:hypothetical protein
MEGFPSGFASDEAACPAELMGKCLRYLAAEQSLDKAMRITQTAVD